MGIASWWRKLPEHTRAHIRAHWIMGMVVGAAVAALLLVLEAIDAGPVRAINHWAYDSMTRLLSSPSVASPPTDGPRVTLIDVDDVTWRDPRWGGGEPVLSPREGLAQLIDQAFARGASFVVLDVLAEPSAAAASQDGESLLAETVERALATDQRRGVVLVRSLRAPVAARLANQEARADRGLYFSEMRASVPLDALAGRSGGRVVAAAPYFAYSEDHVLRDWQLFQVVCDRAAGGEAGTLRVMPSVQLAVLAWHQRWAAEQLPWLQGHGPCRPFPPAEPALADAESRHRASAYSVADFERLERDVHVKAWDQIRELAGTRLALPTAPPVAGSLNNRVVFRFQDAPRSIPAHSLLWGETETMLDLSGDVVVIGQTYAESGDHHPTPIGVMPGATVLVNAIDSLSRHGVIQKPALHVKALVLLIEIVVVAGIYALGGAVLGQFLATLAAIALLVPVSAILFQHGVWLTFALPLLAIQAHAWFDLLREHRELGKQQELHVAKVEEHSND